MTSSQEQLSDLTRRTQESFKHLWQQWSEKSSELMKGMSRTHAAPPAGGDAEMVLDAVFDFAENLIAQQRIFAKQMLAAAGTGQQPVVQATEGPASAPAAEDHPDAGPMGPGHSSAAPPAEDRPDTGPMGPGHSSRPGAG